MRIRSKVLLLVCLILLTVAADMFLVHVLRANIIWARVVTIASFAIILWVTCWVIHVTEKLYVKKLKTSNPNYVFEVAGVRALSRLLQVLAIVVFGLIVLGILQIPISGLLTVGGVGGIAVAYAGKDILTNSLGGVMIYFNRQFVVGDEISSPDRDIAGAIEEMGWRFTTIRRKTGEVMYVPNSVFADIVLVNASRMKH